MGERTPARQPSRSRQLRVRPQHRAGPASDPRIPVRQGAPVRGAVRRRRRGPHDLASASSTAAWRGWSTATSRRRRRPSRRAPTGTCCWSAARSRSSRTSSTSASKRSATAAAAPRERDDRISTQDGKNAPTVDDRRGVPRAHLEPPARAPARCPARSQDPTDPPCRPSRRLRQLLRAVLCRPRVRAVRGLRDRQGGRRACPNLGTGNQPESTTVRTATGTPRVRLRHPHALRQGVRRLHRLRLLRRRAEGLAGHVRRA